MQACAVIGCGPAGIAAATRLRQSGLLVTCFELAPGPGGIWLTNSRDLFSSRGLISPIYPSMRCVLPKDLMAYSDMRFDYTVPQFPHHSAVLRYLEQCATQRGVHGLTRFNTKVESVRYDERDGFWKLITVNVKNGDVMEWSFDKVCVCTGQTQETRFPAGVQELLADYKREGGEVHHASHVKDFRSFRGKRVVVVGDGVSAYDYCTELKRAGARVHHSTTLTRGGGGDASLSSVLFAEADAAAPGGSSSQSRVEKLRRSVFRKRPAGLEDEEGPPRTDALTTLMALTHRLPGRRDSVHGANEVIRRWLRYRAVHMDGIERVGPPVSCGEGRGIVFADDPTRPVRTEDVVAEARRRKMAGEQQPPTGGEGGVLLSDVDAVICATGYHHRFPFLHKDLRRVLEDEPQLALPIRDGEQQRPDSSSGARGRRGLYMGTLLAAQPSLAFVGTQRELLPPFLMFEAQARYVAFAFSQRIALPATAEEMAARETELVRRNPLMADMYSEAGLGLHSAAYYNVLEQELGIGSRDTYSARVAQRQWWLSASSALRVYHKFRSMAPLRRKKQHLLFSNKI